LRQSERHEYELYLAVEDIDHSRTKTKSPQTNGICERFHKTALNEFIVLRSAKKCIVQPTSCKRIWTHGSKNTMRHGHIRDVGASARPPDAYLLGCNANDEGENDRGLTATDTRT
jgi:transposase InsO family protein